MNLLKKLALIMILLAIAVEAFLLFSGARLLATILVIGLWSAFSYSAPPFRLSYIPFLGEWLCAFPAITTLSVAPALLTFHQLPAWALENACIHGLWSLSWLMFHHISDVDADKRATPMKKTTVVLFDLRVKLKYRRKVPVLFYLLITFIVTFWLCLTRPFSGCVSSLFVLLAFYLVATSEIRKPAQHAKSEIGLIALSVVNAIWLGITPFY